MCSSEFQTATQQEQLELVYKILSRTKQNDDAVNDDDKDDENAKKKEIKINNRIRCLGIEDEGFINYL